MTRFRMTSSAHACIVMVCVGALAGYQAGAQAQQVEAWHVQGNVYLLLGAGGNIAVQIGEDGVLVVNTGNRASGAAVVSAIRGLTSEPIRWIINTHRDHDHTGANEMISQAGMTVNGNPAAIIAHENTMISMVAEGRSISELPLNSFFENRRDFFFNGEAVFIEHVPNAHTDGDVIVYFRGSDVLVTGDLFLTPHYPVIDLEHGGSVDGFIAALNRTLDIAVPARLQEGGTYVIPGRGRIGDEADLVEFRDMMVILRDRIAHMIRQGMSLAEVMAARPALDYDTRYDRVEGRGSSAHLVEAMFRDLSARAARE
jgi:cyclase